VELTKYAKDYERSVFPHPLVHVFMVFHVSSSGEKNPENGGEMESNIGIPDRITGEPFPTSLHAVFYQA
jgi:hypothetical protein